ncbi:MAG: sensor histidine kinase [Bryobacteraceae bacterium]
MVPYRGRFALRIARLSVSLLCTGAFLRVSGLEFNLVVGLLALHAVYSAIELIDIGYESSLRGFGAIAMDAAYFGLWVWIAPTGFQAPLACASLLASIILLHDLIRVCLAVGGAFVFTLAVTGFSSLGFSVLSMGALAIGSAVYRVYLEGRMSTTLRHNVVIRSQALSSREAERQRIAADFHDGPLQNFVGFQLRLEIVRKWMERDMETARQELLQLQELCKSQVADLRQFVRTMRPPDEGMSLAASLVRVADTFQRDTGITSTFTGEELQDPQEVDVSLEILQIVREAFNNIQKHSGATRVALRAHRRGRAVEIVIDDNGGGFPFAGAFNLEELEAARLGPVSIKRRIKMLAGELSLDSRPGEGATLTLRVPF